VVSAVLTAPTVDYIAVELHSHSYLDWDYNVVAAEPLVVDVVEYVVAAVVVADNGVHDLDPFAVVVVVDEEALNSMQMHWTLTLVLSFVLGALPTVHQIYTFCPLDCAKMDTYPNTNASYSRNE